LIDLIFLSLLFALPVEYIFVGKIDSLL